MTLVLASGSPRRRELLARLGCPFEVIPSQVRERPAEPGEDPLDYVRFLAQLKADDVAAARPEDVVLAADTDVFIDGTILGKPAEPGDAARMLAALRGKPHCVATSVVVRRKETVYAGTVTAEVTMRNYSDEEVRQYVETGEPMDKAGAYAVQGLGSRLVSSVSGCYETVVGLPLCLVTLLLERCSMTVPAAGPYCRHV